MDFQSGIRMLALLQPVVVVVSMRLSPSKVHQQREVHQSTRSILTESQTAFNGNLKKYQINFDENEIDLLDFMMRNEELIDDFIFEHSQNGSIKVQFAVEVSLMKHLTVENHEEPNVEKVTLFLNTEIVLVNYGGLEQGQNIEMIEHMLNSINCFASHGSGWIIERISKVTINFPKLSPMRAGSYLPLPLGLKKQELQPCKYANKDKR